MRFSPGSLVRARGREWVVLPESQEDLLLLRPLGGASSEVTGILPPLESVEPAQFDLPDPDKIGDHRSCFLLREAVRLCTRAGAGPFRSFARIAVEPRPYQIVPLLMALKLNPVRLLIADDVGIGKTVEASLIARELLDRGEIVRTSVLCPPHLVEQWQAELRDKFHIEAEAVLAGTAQRLERGCRPGQSLFEVHPHTVVSMDFIKPDRRRGEFVRAAPEFVIVDEAHTCAFGYEGRGGRHLRHLLVQELARDPARHMVLVTATPHSGKEDSFRSLLALLDPSFADLPEILAGVENEPSRRRLAAHFVQRRRADIRHYMKTDTPFPARTEGEATYRLSPEYHALFEKVLGYARETVRDPTGSRQHQRVRWWSALALLRSLASSPVAAAATLRTRAQSADAETPEEADEIGRRAVFDINTEDLSETIDVAPGGDSGEDAGVAGNARRRLLEMAREADLLAGDKDEKLRGVADVLKKMLREGRRPIVFCRFIPTADYLAKELERRLAPGVVAVSVTGAMPPSDREKRVLEVAQHPRRILVCTDCLSEGINLQEHFDSVVHYDLAWSPTRHEQREGRVDRFGQPEPKVHLLTYYGIDNQIDGIVLDVLIRKHRKIRSSLGVSVPVPIDSNAVVEAIFEGLLLRGQSGDQGQQQFLPGLEDYLQPRKEELYTRWDGAADREKRSHTVFAQESIKVDEVSREMEEAKGVLGTGPELRTFVLDALQSHGAVVSRDNGHLEVDLRHVPRGLRDALSRTETFSARFDYPVEEGSVLLTRTHPLVENLAAHIMDTALDPLAQAVARRSGAIRTKSVNKRTTLLLVRFRYDLRTRAASEEQSKLVEECGLIAFAGAPENAEWLDNAVAEELGKAEPAANILPEQAASFVRAVVDRFEALQPRINEEAHRRATILLESHCRVREAARLKGVTYSVTPQLPADLLGIYLYLPVGQA